MFIRICFVTLAILLVIFRLSECKETGTISFENNQDVFSPGQLMRGTVDLKLTDKKKVRGVYIKFEGYAHTEWSETVRTMMGNETLIQTNTKSDDREYINSKIFFVGGTTGSLVLEPGDYNYTFELRLPNQMPSSFEGLYGNIRYSAKVVLVIPWGFNVEFKKPFTVIKSLDLNLDSTNRIPVSIEKEFTSYPCCLLFCFPSKPLDIIATLPVRGYAPGQTVNLTLEVDNKSNQRVPPFKISLDKTIKYKAQEEFREESFSIVTQQSADSVEGNQKRTIQMNLRIPPSHPTDVNSDLIKTTYSIYIKSDWGATCCPKPKFDVPITIGSVPLKI